MSAWEKNLMLFVMLFFSYCIYSMLLFLTKLTVSLYKSFFFAFKLQVKIK